MADFVTEERLAQVAAGEFNPAYLSLLASGELDRRVATGPTSRTATSARVTATSTDARPSRVPSAEPASGRWWTATAPITARRTRAGAIADKYGLQRRDRPRRQWSASAP
jgi:hypothetical protein